MSGFTLSGSDAFLAETGKSVRQLRAEKFTGLMDEYEALQPEDIKVAFKYLKTIGMGSEVVAPAVAKIAESPITDVHFEGKGGDAARDLYMNHYKVRDVLLDVSFDLSLYWNAFAMMYLAPTRLYFHDNCKSAKENQPAKGYSALGIKDMTIETKKKALRGICPGCKQKVLFRREDKFYLSATKMRLLRLSPFSITIDHYPLLGQNVYYYVLPQLERDRILKADAEYMNSLPWTFIEAAIDGKSIRLNSNSVYHFAPGGFSGPYPGWAPPRGIASMRSLMYLHALLKSNEVTAEGKINDLTLIYPQMNSSGDNPIVNMRGTDFVTNMKSMLQRYKYDKNAIGFAPGPVGVESVFGHGRAQLLSPEIDQVVRSILGVWGISKEVLYSGTTYASMVVAVKLLASELATKRNIFNRFLNDFLRVHSKRLLETEAYEAKLTPFESADDIQKTSMMVNMKTSGAPIPWSNIMKRVGVDYEPALREAIREEKEARVLQVLQQKNMAESQGEAQIVMNHYQAEAQKLMMASNPVVDPAQAEIDAAQNGVDAPEGSDMPATDDPEILGLHIAMNLLESYGEDRASIEEQLAVVAQQNPEVAGYAEQVINQYLPIEPAGPPEQEQPGGGAPVGGSGEGKPDMRPQPEVLPPRRKSESGV